MRPACQVVSPISVLTSVVLPAPLRPSSASERPSARLRSRPEKTRASPYPALKTSRRAAQPCASVSEIGFAHAGVGGDFGWRAFHQQAAGDQNGNARREAKHQIHVVLDQQDRHVGGQPGQRGEHLGPLADRHAGGRFVEKQRARAARQRQRDFQQPLLAVGQRARRPVHLANQVEAPQQGLDLADERQVGAGARAPVRAVAAPLADRQAKRSAGDRSGNS